MWKQVWHALAEIVGPTPHRAERAHAGGVEHLKRIEPRIDGLGAFEVNNRGERSIRLRPVLDITTDVIDESLQIMEKECSRLAS